MGRYQEWVELTRSVQGFFAQEAAATWDFLLDVQKSPIEGALGEIGVYHGKSAALLALHTGAKEHLYLVDAGEYEEARFLERILRKQ